MLFDGIMCTCILVGKSIWTPSIIYSWHHLLGKSCFKDRRLNMRMIVMHAVTLVKMILLLDKWIAVYKIHFRTKNAVILTKGIHVCVCIYMYMYTYSCIYICVYMYMFIYIYIHTCAYTCIYIHVHVYTCACTVVLHYDKSTCI